jgi:rhodanese-related sulfurtransferase
MSALFASQLAVLQAASARLSRAEGTEAVGRAVVEETGRIIDYHNARVYVVEPGGVLAPIAFEGRVGEYDKVDFALLRTEFGHGFTGWVGQHGEALLVPDANADPRGASIPGTDDVDELAERIDRTAPDDRPLVIDVRQANEYESGHVPGSVHITAGSLPDRLDELPRDHPIVTICAAGLRAGVAASVLRSAGFEDVAWVAQGVPAWRAQGHATVRGDQPYRATPRSAVAVSPSSTSDG